MCLVDDCNELRVELKLKSITHSSQLQENKKLRTISRSWVDRLRLSSAGRAECSLITAVWLELLVDAKQRARTKGGLVFAIA